MHKKLKFFNMPEFETVDANPTFDVLESALPICWLALSNILYNIVVWVIYLCFCKVHLYALTYYFFLNSRA